VTYQAGQSLPDKLYFRIGEVSDIVGVKPYVLRYWETEFSDVKPTKSKSGQRLYRKKDVELLLKVRELLYAERFTINGAKQRLKGSSKPAGAPAKAVVQEALQPAEASPEQVIAQDDLFTSTETKPEAVSEKEPVIVQAKEEVALNPVAVPVAGTDKKFLEKMKTDLEWCLAEMRSG
jgi:DNA-binding transcriptional MerR regulator